MKGETEEGRVERRESVGEEGMKEEAIGQRISWDGRCYTHGCILVAAHIDNITASSP